ncbi:3'-5' exoribonuclease YhaM family protein [Floccifex sp.]|uniref:3'-5' exoribonuclease YhaM family protein n=1 Tax=Floccifex sp. TaxID=2815810 RepID=UPI002A75EB98|nr:HD domain-containing protein [Floccifex sp.]MDD7282168.1 HD domain-containing protein [Erysipelotrichaceae bacterium]MDY2959061.1 HD domain-containing protein [Floccifex sp.]
MIKDIVAEGKVSLPCLISRCDKAKTVKGTPYLSLTLEDASGVLDAKFWNLTDEQVESYKVGMIVQAVGDIIIHKNAIQLKVRTLKELENEKITDYVRQAPMSVEQMKEEIDGYVSQIKNEDLFLITQTILENVEDEYYSYSAAKKNHHNYVGGLAFHSLSMVRLSLRICELYPYLDADLLISACLLHDIGKIEEFSSPVLPEYTAKGNLIGHISIFASYLDRISYELGLQDKESILLLKHMILSHHGKNEYGSPVLPMIPEAEVLSMVDNLDSRLFMMKQSIDATQPGEFGPRIFALENRMIYHRKDEQ